MKSEPDPHKAVWKKRESLILRGLGLQTAQAVHKSLASVIRASFCVGNIWAGSNKHRLKGMDTMTRSFAIALVFIAVCAGNASAAGQNEVKVAGLEEAQCKKEVTQYVNALQFVKQSAGEQMSNKVMKNYVSIDHLQQTAANAGPCAAAQLLREKRATK